MSSHSRTVCRHRSIVVVSARVLACVVLLLGFSSSTFAQQPGAGAPSSPSAEAPALNQGFPILGEQGGLLNPTNVLAGCRYCELPSCGCVENPYCVLIYSCSCSSISCTRSCQQTDCQQ